MISNHNFTFISDCKRSCVHIWIHLEAYAKPSAYPGQSLRGRSRQGLRSADNAGIYPAGRQFTLTLSLFSLIPGR